MNIRKWLEERRKFRRLKYFFKNYCGSLKKKHGCYILKFSQREGPRIFLDVYQYTLQSTSLDDLMDEYNAIAKKSWITI